MSSGLKLATYSSVQLNSMINLCASRKKDRMGRKRRKRTLDDRHLALDGDLRYPPGSFLHDAEGTGELVLQLRGLLGLRRGRREAEGKRVSHSLSAWTALFP
jgi:hypothetical protein